MPKSTTTSFRGSILLVSWHEILHISAISTMGDITSENLDFGIFCGIMIAICTLHCRRKFDDRGSMSKSSRQPYRGY